MERTALLRPSLPPVCRLGLATRGNTVLCQADVEWAIERGINYLNWCGHPDALSQTIAALGSRRQQVVVALQFESRTAREAAREFPSILKELRTGYIDVATLYYVESGSEWDAIAGPNGALEYLEQRKREGALRMIGVTSHQRRLAASWAGTGKLDLLMVRYNAAHRGAEKDVFPVTRELGIPVVAFTGLRWKALLKSTPEDPGGFTPPPAREFYRFCLAEPSVAVALTAPSGRAELEGNLSLLDDWRPPGEAELDLLRAHGDRVRRHAGAFP
ncbi:MAG: aldo/keto reductase [Bryobacteraceae bacterium]